MDKFIRHVMFALMGAAFTFSAIAAPVASAHASDVKTTVKSYDMDEYLDMLLATGQYDKYDKFVKIADQEAYAKHVAKYTNWRNGYPIYAGDLSDPVDAAKADAALYGLNADKDQFILLSQTSGRAWVKILHSGRTYYASMLQSKTSDWYIKALYQIGK